MSDADAFIDAIRANPDDDTPRLVYADWLTEHGQEAYAEFIRLTCRLRRDEMPEKEKARLGRQRFKLWKQVLAENAPAFEGNPLSMDHFPRGICRPALTVEASTFVKTSAHWWPLICPRELTLSESNGQEYFLTQAAYLSRVTALRLACQRRFVNEHGQWVNDPLDPGAIRALATPPHLTSLRKLTIDSAWATEKDLIALRDSLLCQRLTELYVGVRLRDGTEAALFPTQRPPGPEIASAVNEFLAANRHQLEIDPPIPSADPY